MKNNCYSVWHIKSILVCIYMCTYYHNIIHRNDSWEPDVRSEWFDNCFPVTSNCHFTMPAIWLSHRLLTMSTAHNVEHVPTETTMPGKSMHSIWCDCWQFFQQSGKTRCFKANNTIVDLPCSTQAMFNEQSLQQSRHNSVYTRMHKSDKVFTICKIFSTKHRWKQTMHVL